MVFHRDFLVIFYRYFIYLSQVDDEKVISGSYDLMLKIWDIRTGVCRRTLRSVVYYGWRRQNELFQLISYVLNRVFTSIFGEEAFEHSNKFRIG